MENTRWLDDREQRIWRAYLAMQVGLGRRLSRRLNRETGLSDADYYVLVSLSEAPEGRLRVFELRRAAQWEKSRLTHQITRMAQRGLVERQACPSDPRGAFVALTEAGRTAITTAAPRHVAHVRRWFIDVLTPDQLAALEEIADVVVRHLAADNPDDAPESDDAPDGAPESDGAPGSDQDDA